MIKQRRTGYRPLDMVAMIAAVTYCLWVVGYIINPTISLGGMASELAVSSQPLHYMFTYGDVACSLIMISVAIYAILVNVTVKVRLIMILYGLFGLFTMFAALNPLQCTILQTPCSGYAYSIHIFFGATAAVCLLLSVVMLGMLKNVRLSVVEIIAIGVWLAIGMYEVVFPLGGPSYFAALLQRILLLIVAYYIYRVPRTVLTNDKLG